MSDQPSSTPNTVDRLAGYHHLTMVAKHAPTNVRFYRDLLGLRMVKQTVNFDMPETYHLYYGEGEGSPGTILTFFEWPTAKSGTPGFGGAHHIALRVGSGAALAYWRGHLEREGLDVEGPLDDHGTPAIRFRDPDGLLVELVAPAGEEVPDGAPALSSPGYAIGAIDHAAVLATNRDTALAYYTRMLGFHPRAEAPSTSVPGAADIVFDVSGDDERPQRLIVSVLERGSAGRARMGTGLTHHIAFNVPDDPQELAWRERLEALGIPVTEVRDRKYFHSIYFNDPDGFLIEIATATPGFAVDEPAEALGRRLQLPPWLEETRGRLEQTLTPLD